MSDAIPAAEAVSVTFRFDMEDTPERRAELLVQLTSVAQNLGAIGITTEVVHAASQSPEHTLDESFGWLLDDLSPQRRSITQGALSSQGFRNIRHLLVMGADRLMTLGEVGPSSISSIRNQLWAAKMPVVLKDRPTVQDMVELCDEPGDIPVQVVMHGGFDNRRYDVGLTGPISIVDAADSPIFESIGGTERYRQRAAALVADFWQLKRAKENST